LHKWTDDESSSNNHTAANSARLNNGNSHSQTNGITLAQAKEAVHFSSDSTNQVNKNIHVTIMPMQAEGLSGRGEQVDAINDHSITYLDSVETMVKNNLM
jgi:hypothetical protein